MASRLSYFFLDTMPDDGLFARRREGQAGQRRRGRGAGHPPDGRCPRSAGTLSTFHQEWLQTETLAAAEKDAQLFPQWNPALRDALGEETRRFVEHVFTEGDQRLETLLAAPFSFLDAPLATFYGVPRARRAVGCLAAGGPARGSARGPADPGRV